MTNALIVLDACHLDAVYGDNVARALDQRVRWTGTPQTAESLQRDPSPLLEAEALFTGWGAPALDEALLAAAPRLRAVFHAAGSIRPIVTPAFWRRTISITHAAAVNGGPTADFSVSAILLSLKHVWRLSQYARTHGKFPSKQEVPGVYGSTVGLVSLGTVGQRVAQQLRTFGVQLRAHDPYIDAAKADSLGVALCSLDELFRTCEVVSLHAPLLESTRGLITGAHLASMKPRATFINTARGAIVREREMIEVLERRPDLTALLDVTDPEPPVAGSRLYSLPNVILTPHVAGSRGLECRQLGHCMVEEFDRYRLGQPMKYALNEAQAAALA